jgi:hypothetical protein
VKVSRRIELGWENQRRAFNPALILFIAPPWTDDKAEPVVEISLAQLPCRCPICGQDTIIGHGRRHKQAHDDRHDGIWVWRGRCPACKKTFTALRPKNSKLLPLSAISGMELRPRIKPLIQVSFGQTLYGVEAKNFRSTGWSRSSERSQESWLCCAFVPAPILRGIGPRTRALPHSSAFPKSSTAQAARVREWALQNCGSVALSNV